MSNILQAVLGTPGKPTQADTVLRYSFAGLVITGVVALGFLMFQGHSAFNSSSMLPLPTARRLTASNIPDSATPIRRAKSENPRPPPIT